MPQRPAMTASEALESVSPDADVVPGNSDVLQRFELAIRQQDDTGMGYRAVHDSVNAGKERDVASVIRLREATVVDGMAVDPI